MENRKRNQISIPEWLGTAAFMAAVPYLFFVVILADRISSRAMFPTGDEPHYLIVAHSLAVDGDLSLANNYLEKHYRIFYKGEIAKRTSPSADKKRELPAQGLGLSFLLAPFYKLALWLFPPTLTIVLRLAMCSITAIVLYQLVQVVVISGASLRSGFFTVCGAFFASPLLTYSSLFYPEIPACLLVTLAIRRLLDMEEHRNRAFVELAIIPAALLWLHPKYLALSLCIAITAAIFFYRTFKIYKNDSSIARSLLYTVFAAAGIFSFFFFLNDLYGGWSPNRIYAGWDKEPQSLLDLIRQEGIARIGTMLRMSVGLWIDQRFGLIPYAPLYLLFFPGAFLLLKTKSELRFVLVWFAIHFLILCWGAPLGGFAPPSRHMIVLLPIILIAVSHVFSHYGDLRKHFAVMLFVASWGIAVFLYFNFRALFTSVTWRNPDGISPFWEGYGLNRFIPLLTATDLHWTLILLWCFILIGLSLLLFPRAKMLSNDDS